nr:hypothetical protein CFP56_75183 [Quercus suber]
MSPYSCDWIFDWKGQYVDDGSQSFVNDVGVPLIPDPEVVDGEVYNPPENGQASIEEEEILVGEVVDEVSDEWQIVAESNSETEETPKKVICLYC